MAMTAERREKIKAFVLAHPERYNNVLAVECGCSESLIGTLRKELGLPNALAYEVRGSRPPPVTDEINHRRVVSMRWVV